MFGKSKLYPITDVDKYSLILVKYVSLCCVFMVICFKITNFDSHYFSW